MADPLRVFGGNGLAGISPKELERQEEKDRSSNGVAQDSAAHDYAPGLGFLGDLLIDFFPEAFDPVLVRLWVLDLSER